MMNKNDVVAGIGFVIALTIPGFILLSISEPDREILYYVSGVLTGLLIGIGIPITIALLYLVRIKKKGITLNINWKKSKIAGLCIMILTITLLIDQLLSFEFFSHLTIIISTIASMAMVSKWSSKARKETIQKH